jgi:short-subunit dehydrogenase
MQLEGKRALITGAGSGIGRALAIEASHRGMAVALVGRRRGALEATRTRLADRTEYLILPADVTDGAARRSLKHQIAREWGGIDILINNAGVVHAGPLATMPDTELERMMATNLVAPLALTREFLPVLSARPGSRIVNVGSMFGDIAFPLFAAYSASKFGLRGFSTALRREVAELGIGVTYAAPRGTRTDATPAIEEFIEPFAMKLDDPYTVAIQIWDAILLGSDSVYPRGPERFFAMIERLFPRIVGRSLILQLQKSGLGHRITESVLQ